VTGLESWWRSRQSFVNALTLAKLLNRTLLVPPVLAGAPVEWSTRLQKDLDARVNEKSCESLDDDSDRVDVCLLGLILAIRL
jgi:hypothetical protein